MREPGGIPTEAACLAADRTDGRSQPCGRTPPTSPRPWRPVGRTSAARRTQRGDGCERPSNCYFEVSGDLSVLPAAVEVAAYRIAQEAISNATKHAGAQRITVRMNRTENGLTVEVDDDGIGVVANMNH